MDLNPTTASSSSATVESQSGVSRPADRWNDLADRVLGGNQLTLEEGLAILQSDDNELLDLLFRTFLVIPEKDGVVEHIAFDNTFRADGFASVV